MSFPRPVRACRTWNRTVPAAALLALIGAGLAACDLDDDASVVPRTDAEGLSQMTAEAPGQSTAAASALAYASSDIAVLGSAGGSWAVSEKVEQLGVPGLLASDGAREGGDSQDGAVSEPADSQAVTDELDRLGVSTVFVPSDQDAPAEVGDRTVVTYDPQTLEPQDGDAPEVDRDGDATNAWLFVDRGSDGTPGQEVAGASVRAAGGTVAELPGGDPRATSETVEAAKSSEGSGVLALGEGFGGDELLTSRLETARTAPELNGGGQAPFPGRRMIAAYGSPGMPALGILGEQDLEGTIDRVQGLAEEYEPYSDEPVVPAMEIITTVASDQPGADGNHSTELDPETLRPWIDRAGEEGIYVVLDLQPGTSGFPEQAEMYEDLLKEPHVGLALDPEWRLEDGQRHLEQIGSVDAAEINETAAWLADLTAENDLPQKVFVLHQFSMSMITDRADVDTSHDELAMLLHADGNGTPEMKTETWNTLREGLPDGIRMAWKNFYDEDSPTFTPEETMEVEPAPWFVSYQ